MNGLELDGVTRRFGSLVALDDVSFTVEPGELVGFVGSNGAGKTTAMRIVMGILDADAGEVRFGGTAVTRRQRGRFGFLPEERGLYPKVPARRQLAYLGRLHGMARREAYASADRLLGRLGLAGREAERVERLSLGNQQRVQLAAALVHDPELLVLDEPFSGLDPLGVDALAEVLVERARAGVPVLLSSHQLDLLERLCDAVVIIHAGRIAAAGSVAELRTRRSVRLLEVELAGSTGSAGSVAAERSDGRGPAPLASEGSSAGPDAFGWATPGVRVVERTPTRWLLELDPDVDEQRVLDAARAAGRVVRFAFGRPSLSQLYREVLAP